MTGAGTRGWYQMSRVGASQLKLALQIHLGDIHVEHRHAWGGVSKQFHDGRQADSGAEHFGDISMAKLMGDDAGGDSDGSSHLVQRSAEIANEGLAAKGGRYEEALHLRRRIVGTQRL